ncbi:AfsR/SARP family transcriptional regulator [Kitasatospora mediocidica]|uniref:AfsR/SARP family transcriptional regulator n=1 Tax=Kitasatospora mediocidica TaxID=58352 RepID=UPI00068F3A18|nr:AfsR/SARP family transcriptional regulator [Kitasatospora mediocidica]
MQFRILGPIEVWNGRRVDLGGPKQRTLMAALLLGAGRVQSVDRLVEALWGDRPPASAHNLVSVYVYQLRKRLGPEGASVLLTAPPGYLLQAEEGGIDLHAFEQLAAEARQAARRGDHRLAVSRFRAGLALWRGPVVCGVESALLERLYLPQLEEARLTALEDLVDSEFALGNPAGPIGELRTLVAKHPFRERLHHQLMLALYRSGRRVEALEAYWRVRALLSEEMGIDPGQRLQELMQAILADELPPAASPGAAPSGPDRPAAGVVGAVAGVGVGVGVGGSMVVAGQSPAPAMQAPAAVELVGRGAERRLLRERLQGPTGDGAGGGRVAVIGGPPGVGKSALLAQCAQDLRAHYPDGQLYADLADTPVADALADFLVALGVPRGELPQGTSRRAGFFRGVTYGLRVLVLLDNAPSERQVRPLVPASPGSAVLVAADGRLAALESAVDLDLGPLDPQAGLAMLEHLVGRARVAAERKAAEELVRLCDGLPLALRIAGARLAVRPDLQLARLAHRLTDRERRLVELRVGDLDLRGRLVRGYQRLDPPARELFRRLGSVPPGVLTTGRLAELVQGDPTPAADSLVQAHLLTIVGWEDGAGPRYRLLGLLRDFAEQLHRAERTRTTPFDYLAVGASPSRPWAGAPDTVR